jgi:hypothetical protein
VEYVTVKVSSRAVSEVVAAIIIVVIGVIIAASVLVIFSAPTSTTGNQQQSTSTQPTTITISQSSSIYSSSSCNLWKYPGVFNQTITLENSTILFSLNETTILSIPAHQALYIGFTLTKQADISGEVKSTSPFNFEILRSNGNASVFPVSSEDVVLIQKTNTTDAAFFLPSGISGTIGAGNYALLFENPVETLTSLSVVHNGTVVYYSCS